jgi:RHS repeat-associated protein
MERFAFIPSLFLLWCATLALTLALLPSQAQAQTNGASFVSQSVPSAMTAGQTYNVSVTMLNSGTTTWTTASLYRLGSENPQNNTTWGINRVAVPASIAPGQQATFSWTVTAPATPGTYNFQWQIVEDQVAWIGPLTPNVAVVVSAPATVNDATFVSQSVPSAMTAGQTYNVSVTMLNSGTTTWTTASLYRLGSENPQNNTTWGINRVAVPASIAPGQQATFSWTVTAPATAGTYNFQWQMVEDQVAWIGPLTPNVAVAVSAPAVNGASFISQSVPSAMVAGQTYNVSVTMLNSGTTTWTTALLYRLGSENPQNNTTWGTSRIPLPSSIAPGQQATFSWTVTAPATPGTYNFQWQMVEDQVGWIGPLTPNVAVTVSATAVDGATFVTQSVPSAMVAGQSYNASVTLQNSGSTTWTTASLYHLCSQNPQNNTTWGASCIALATSSIAPGQQAVFSYAVTAPATPGTYNFQWQLATNNTWISSPTPNVAVVVNSATPPTASLATPTNGSTYTAVGSTASVAVTGTGTARGSATITALDVLDGTTLLGSVNTGTISITAALAVGSHSLQLRATDSQGATGLSAISSITVVAGVVPTITVQRTPSPLIAGQNTTLTWSSTNATSVSYVCTASGTGYAGSATLAASGTSTTVADAAWVGFPSTCIWTATGAGGSKTYTETVTTVAAGGATVTYFHNDASGTPLLATDANGNVVWKENYRPYGDKLNNQTASSANDIGFAGKPYDQTTGLSYMGARYYEPMLGRFMGVDSVGFDPNNIHSFNRYAYANNNPCKFVDPDGRIALLAVVEVLGIVTIGVISYASQTPERQARLRHALSNLFHSGSAHAQAGDEAKAEPTKGDTNKGTPTSPTIDPKDVGGKTPDEIDKLAGELGLQPKGPDPKGGRGAYVDPVTGEQRILVHGDHTHVNDPSGNRLDINGNKVPAESPAAHLPIGVGK